MSSRKRLVVTGASGFVGGHLLRALVAESTGWEIHAWSHGRAANTIAGVTWSSVDIENATEVESGIQVANPSHLIHLAATSNVAGSFANPQGTWSVNVMGSLNLLEAVRHNAPDANFILVSSSEVYGDAFGSGEPLGEDAPLQPQNPYAASKAAAELLARTYVKRSMRLVVVRPFNHIGPGQSAAFAVSSFARQLARIEAGLQPPQLTVGNLEARRDFLDVADVAQAYVRLLERIDRLPSGATLNLCSGTPRRVGEVLDELRALCGVDLEVVPDPEEMRPSDIPVAVGTAHLAEKYLGWRPETPWRLTLQRILADWRERVATEKASDA